MSKRPNLVLTPILERRRGKVIPSHRWEAPKDKLGEALRRPGWPGQASVGHYIGLVRGASDGATWERAVSETSFSYPGGWLDFVGPHYAEALSPFSGGKPRKRISIPRYTSFLFRLFGARSWPDIVRLEIPNVPRGRELEAALLHELLHAYEATLQGTSLWKSRLGAPLREAALSLLSPKAAQQHPGLSRFLRKAFHHPAEVLPTVVELALWSPDEFEALRRLLLGRGIDLYRYFSENYRLDLKRIRAPHTEHKVRMIVLGLAGGGR